MGKVRICRKAALQHEGPVMTASGERTIVDQTTGDCVGLPLPTAEQVGAQRTVEQAHKPPMSYWVDDEPGVWGIPDLIGALVSLKSLS